MLLEVNQSGYPQWEVGRRGEHCVKGSLRGDLACQKCFVSASGCLFVVDCLVNENSSNTPTCAFFCMCVFFVYIL